jgi:hypothetical protein
MFARFVSRESILVIYGRDLPSMATHADQQECGYSVYKGVLVQWDEDQDARVFDFIDDLDGYTRCCLAAVQEHEGNLALLWKKQGPLWPTRDNTLEVAGDIWNIVSSEILRE